MAKVLKKMEFNDETGRVDIEYDDNTNRSFNLADTVTASTTSSGGIEVQDGSDTRGFVTAEIAAGVPTGNFS